MLRGAWVWVQFFFVGLTGLASGGPLWPTRAVIAAVGCFGIIGYVAARIAAPGDRA